VSRLSLSRTAEPLTSRATVGLDIGTTAVRAVEVDGDRDGVARVTALAVVPVPRGAVVSGRISDTKAVAGAVIEALEILGGNRRRVVVGLATPDTAVASRAIHSGLRRHEREAVVRNDAVAVSARLVNDTSALDTYVAGAITTSTGGDRDDIVIAAAQQQHVDELSKVCRAAGINPLAIDLSGAALLRALVRVDEHDDTAAAYCDLGAGRTTVVGRRGRHVRSLRTIPTSGDDITRAVMNALGSTWNDAERAKRLLRPTLRTVADTPAADAAYTRALDDIVDQIAIGVDAGRKGGDDPQTLVLTGRSSQLNGLVDRLAARTGLQVVSGRPWAELVDNRANAIHLADTTRLDELIMSLATAIGLAQWKDHA
jgi:type IV pilus assembly protein PilM